jgi:hypothetical protein
MTMKTAAEIKAGDTVRLPETKGFWPYRIASVKVTAKRIRLTSDGGQRWVLSPTTELEVVSK